MTTLLDPVQVQAFAAPPATGGPANEPNPIAGGFAALLAAPASSGACPTAGSANPTAEAVVVAVPGAASAVPDTAPPPVEPVRIAPAAATADGGSCGSGQAVAHLGVDAPVIPPEESRSETPNPLLDPEFSDSPRASSNLVPQERLEAPGWRGADAELLAGTSAILVPSVHELVLTLCASAPVSGQEPVENPTGNAIPAAGVAQAMPKGSPPIPWSGATTVGADQRTLRAPESSSAPLGNHIANGPPFAHGFGSAPQPADHPPSRPGQAVALSLADLLHQDAPATPTIPVTQVEAPEASREQPRPPQPADTRDIDSSAMPIQPPVAPAQPQEPPGDFPPLPIAAAVAQMLQAVPATDGPERPRKAAPPPNLAESAALSANSPATLAPVADATWKPVASPVDAGPRRIVPGEKTVPREEARIPDLALGASFIQTDPNPVTASGTEPAANPDDPADGRFQAQAPAAADPLLPAAAARVAAPESGSDAPVRFSPAPASAPEANPVERMIAHQVSRAVLRHVGDGDRNLVIRLTPPELGTVRIEFRMQEGRLCAHFQAEDPAVRQALERVLPQLAGDLRQADSPIQQITVGASSGADQAFDGRGFDGRGGQHANRQDQHGQAPRQRRGERVQFSLDGSTAPVAAAILPPTRVRAPAGLVDTLA